MSEGVLHARFVNTADIDRCEPGLKILVLVGQGVEVEHQKSEVLPCHGTVGGQALAEHGEVLVIEPRRVR